MDMFVIQGGTRLRGEVRISGAKNAALPIMAACLLTNEECVIRSVPDLADTRHLITLLENLGARVRRDESGALRIKVEDESISLADYESVRRMRASICVLGPLLARRGKAEVSMPGGCAIGDRPVNLHLRGMEALGAKIHLDGGNIITESQRLQGTDIFLGGPFGSTVLGTANVMTAACLAQGRTVIEAAACEPEVIDLGDFLNSMGAKVSGHGTPRIIVEGVDDLHGTDYEIIPDRIEAGTFMIAAAITNGELTLKGCRTEHLMALIDRLNLIGVEIERIDNDTVRVSSARRLNPVDITTQPYPGFPTDLQAQLMTLLCLADGNSIITEKIFPDRFMHTAELNRMGAMLRKEGPTVVVQGVRELIGAPVMASDLRASAALVLAGMVARGQTEVLRVYHIDRGYEHIERKLNPVGAQIERVKENG
ncbi:MAG: UDP-N-acetylglucosamine 1-carboxyvinyltransferase [Sedimentisphaerales bacterium]|nr:UDP-N-acetylglucosamine 1-carboxyvinyltransferase [Sedimentisphaerales bacterium]